MAVLLDGIVFGLQLSLLAVGMTLIYGLGGVLNLAHGQFAVIAAIVGALLLAAGLPVVVVVPVAVGAAVATAMAVDQTLMRPVYRLTGERRVLLSLLLTLGLAMLIDGLVITTYPFTALNLRVVGPPIDLLGVPMRRGSVIASAVALAASGSLIVLLRASRLGAAIRAMIQDEDGAQLSGVNPSAIRTVVFALSGAYAGMFAITRAMSAPVGAGAGMNLTILALIVTVVGGLGRITGTLLAGLLLGIVHSAASNLLGSVNTFVLLLVVAIAAIIVRPHGLVGRWA